MAAMTLRALKSIKRNGCTGDAMILVCPHWLVGIIVPFVVGGIILESIVCCIPYAFWGYHISKDDSDDGGNNVVMEQVDVHAHTGLVNDEDAPLSMGSGNCSHKYYCGRFFGQRQLPNSNGYCGPSNGPQCQSCQRFQFGPQNPNNNNNNNYNYANNNDFNNNNNNTTAYNPSAPAYNPPAPAYNPPASGLNNPNLLNSHDLLNANSFNNNPPAPAYTAPFDANAPPSYNEATTAEGSPTY